MACSILRCPLTCTARLGQGINMLCFLTCHFGQAARAAARTDVSTLHGVWVGLCRKTVRSEGNRVSPFNPKPLNPKPLNPKSLEDLVPNTLPAGARRILELLLLRPARRRKGPDTKKKLLGCRGFG